MSNQQNNNTSVTAILLAAGLDFGRCKLASRFVPALWPIFDQPAVSRLLNKLYSQSVSKAVICCNGNFDILSRSVAADNPMDLHFFDEPIPSGTAGCIRDAANFTNDDTFLIIPAQLVNLPDLTDAINRHKNNQAALTMLFAPSRYSSAAVIYIANRDIIKWIPSKGYFDIKENLVSVLFRNGQKVIAEYLPSPLLTFRNHSQYLHVLFSLLSEENLHPENSTYTNWRSSLDIFVSCNAKIDPSVRIFGPAVIGPDVCIDNNSIICQSALWKGSTVGKNCSVSQCVVDYNTIIPSNSIAKNNTVVHRKTASIEENILLGFDRILTLANSVLKPAIEKINYRLTKKTAAFVVLLAVFFWSFLPQIRDLFQFWNISDEYSAGLLVPFLASLAIFSKRKNIMQMSFQPCFLGILLFFFAQIIRFFGLYYMYSFAERLSIVLSIWSIVIIILGFRPFLSLFPSFLFLLLMLPPPRIIHTSLMLPLQNMATICAAFCLQTVGYAVIRQGNILLINNNAVAVSEACNGLRMITAFFIIVVFISLIIRKNTWEKILLLLSGLPIAFVCNIIRLTFTAVIFTIVSGRKWTTLFHDFGGFAMVPLAIALVVLELWLMNSLVTWPQKNKTQIVMPKFNN